MRTTLHALLLGAALPLAAEKANFGLNPVLFPRVVGADAFYAGRGWQDWIGSRPSRDRDRRGTPSATVEVVGYLSPPETRQEKVQAFAFYIAPRLQRAFDIGGSSSVGRQMLAEFMSMNPARLTPPSLPSVFYNSYKLLLHDLERRNRILDPNAARP